ncbi:hypothetical protein [Vulcanisaeta distributa]|uniref:hypothetical protein n=1 Tax=Vulcanisaeta distributa TaxID=164451 RepID=UPI001FB1B05C|nr:hypothetical protein [Vulcanisaeta distributa]
MVQGFSWDLTAWHFQWELGYRFRLVLIDNRGGVGLSDKPRGGRIPWIPWPMTCMLWLVSLGLGLFTCLVSLWVV